MSTTSPISGPDANNESQGALSQVWQALLIVGNILALIALFWVLYRAHLLSRQLVQGFFFGIVGAALAVLLFQIIRFTFSSLIPPRIDPNIEIKDLTDFTDHSNDE